MTVCASAKLLMLLKNLSAGESTGKGVSSGRCSEYRTQLLDVARLGRVVHFFETGLVIGFL